MLHLVQPYIKPLPKLTATGTISTPYRLIPGWQHYFSNLSPSQAEERQEILVKYYQQFIADETAIARPLAVEGKIQGRLVVMG